MHLPYTACALGRVVLPLLYKLTLTFSIVQNYALGPRRRSLGLQVTDWRWIVWAEALCVVVGAHG